jgi:glycosyltransferase involved in cell wall biosynthesis
VDDSSTDGSAAIAADWAERDPRVKLVRHRRNAGVGAAIATGLAHATKDWFAVNCADRPFDTRDIVRLRPLFETADLVVVSRTDRSANSPYRKLTSWVNYLLIRLLFRIPVGDCQFVQFYRTAWLKDARIISRSTLVPPELILRMVRQGARIAQAQLPFHARPGGVAKYGHPKHALRALAEMARLRLHLWRVGLGGAGAGHPMREKTEGPR